MSCTARPEAALEASLVAVDPGPTDSAFVWYERRGGVEVVRQKGYVASAELRLALYAMAAHADPPRLMAIEMIASYGMAVGAPTFETCVWIGRLVEAWGGETRRVYNGEIRMHLCKSAKAGEANIRRALLDRFSSHPCAVVGTREPAIGDSRRPGPLYGVKGDVWSALAVAVTVADGGCQVRE